MVSRIHIPTARKNGQPYEEPDVLYIGNEYKRGPYNFEASDWANPHYKMAKHDREKCVALFREYLLANEELMARLSELSGRTLGCWCKREELCHGDVLIELFKERYMSPLAGTNGDHGVRAMIREYARAQEGYDARLYDLWEKWNDEFFEGRMVPSLIQLTDPGQTHCYGVCTNFSGLAGIRSAIKIRVSILDGTLRDLKHGSRNPEGLRRFLEDVLLHEMIHQWHFEVTGEGDESYSGHGPAFSAKANEIGARLGLEAVGRTCKKRDHKDKGVESPSQWPHDVRPDGYYLGAHVPARVDKPRRVSVPLDIEQAIPVLQKHFDVAELCRRLAEGLEG